MKKIITLILVLVSIESYSQIWKLYAERKNSDASIDSFNTKFPFRDSVFNQAGNFISLTVELTNQLNLGVPSQFANYHLGADGIYRNYMPRANEALSVASTNVTGLSASLTLKANLASPTFTGTVTLPNNTVTNSMLAGSIDLTTKVTGTLPFANGGSSGGSAATSATTGTMTVNMTSRMITCTPTGNCTFNASGGIAGQMITFIITTSGTTSFTLTWGTNFRKTGTLATGTVSARFFAVSFICLADGVTWQEISRTAAQT